MTPHLAPAAALLERRAVLLLAAAAAAAGLLPSGCGSVSDELAPATPGDLRVLTPRTYAVLTAASARLVGPRGATLIAQRSVDPARAADGLLARSPSLAGPLAQALLVLEFGIAPLVAKLRPFTALAGDAQDAVLTDLMTSRLELKRALFGGVRSLALAGFYGAPETRTLTGYPGPFGTGAVTIADGMISLP